MQRWEYLWVQCLHSNPFGYIINGGMEITVEDAPARDFIKHVSALLNKMGLQGWELIAKDESSYLFKRPI